MPRLLTAAALAVGVTTCFGTAAWGQQDLVSQARRLDLAGRAEEAIAIYEKALAQDPGLFDAHYGIARALDLSGRYDEARLHFGRAIELASEGEKDQALRMMGVSYTFVGDASHAASYFTQVFDRRVGSNDFAGAAEVAGELGRVFLELGDTQNARAWYRRAYDTSARAGDRPPSDADLAELRWAHAQRASRPEWATPPRPGARRRPSKSSSTRAPIRIS